MIASAIPQADCSGSSSARPASSDIIVSANGTNVGDVSVLNRPISDVRIGSTITLGLVREGRRIEVRIRIVRSTRNGSTKN